MKCDKCNGTGQMLVKRFGIGQQMRARRLRKNISLTAVAICMNCSLQFVSDLECGRRAWTMTTRSKYLEALQ